MKPVELSRCIQYARTECDKLKNEALEEGAEIDFFIKAYDTTISYMGYGIRFYVSFFGITEEYYTGCEQNEDELKSAIDKQVARMRKEII